VAKKLEKLLLGLSDVVARGMLWFFAAYQLEHKIEGKRKNENQMGNSFVLSRMRGALG